MAERFDKAVKVAAIKTNKKYAIEIAELSNPYLFNLFKDRNKVRQETLRIKQRQYTLDTMGNLFGGIIKLGIGYWGFSQENVYGNVTGSVFALSGTIQIITIKW